MTDFDQLREPEHIPAISIEVIRKYVENQKGN